MSVATEVINNSGRILVLKEGNGGTYRKLATLEVSGPKCKFCIICNTAATSREFWVGTGVKDGDQSKVTINSDDCVAYETIYIKQGPNSSTELILDPIKRGSATEVVNRTGGVARLKPRLKNGSEEISIEIPSNEKVLLQPGSKGYSVVLEGEEPIPLTNKQVAKNQRIDIISASGSEVGAKLDMVTRGLYLTEVTNKSSGAIKVKHLKGSGGAATVLATLQTGDNYTIKYDPKKKDHKYSVEYSSAAAGSPPHGLDPKSLVENSSAAAGSPPHGLDPKSSVENSSAAAGSPPHGLDQTSSVENSSAAAGSPPHGLDPKSSVENSSAAAGSPPHGLDQTSSVENSSAAACSPPHVLDQTSSVGNSSAAACSPPHVLELPSSVFANSMTIAVVDGQSGGMKVLQELRPRPSADKRKDGTVSRFLGWLETRFSIFK